MLAEHEPFAVVQSHVERVLAGGGHLVSSGGRGIVTLIIAALGVVPVDHLNKTVPGAAAVNTGAHDHSAALVQAAAVLFVDRALDPEITELGHGHERELLTVVVVSAGFVDLLDSPVHRREDFSVFKSVLSALDLLFLGSDAEACLGDLYLELLYLERVAQLCRRAGVGSVAFELFYLRTFGLNGVFELFQFKRLFFEFKTQRLCIVGEKDLAFFYQISRRDANLAQLKALVLFDVDGLAGFNDTGVTVEHQRCARAGYHAHRLDGYGRSGSSAAARKRQQRRQEKYQYGRTSVSHC